MKILFISAFYPPHAAGGWEANIENLNHRFQQRGHRTFVLTSRHGLERPSTTDAVDRALALESDLQRYRPLSVLSQGRRLTWNLQRTEQAIATFRPDVVFVHILWNLSRGVPWIAERLMPGRVVYYMATPWAYPPDTRELYWAGPANRRVRDLAKRPLAKLVLGTIRREHTRFRLAFEHVLCVSEASRAAIARELGRSPATMQVIHNGVEPELFFPRDGWEARPAHQDVTLLFAGNVASHKGVHTAVNALVRLREQGSRPSLTIAGPSNADYEATLRALVRDQRLESQVRFAGNLPRDRMPDLMREHDVFLLPSIWEEPLARVMQEAMACGLLVIGTNTGGTGELLVHEETGLVFPPDDAVALAACIRRASLDPVHAHRLAAAGRRRVLGDFSLDRMVDRLEAYLIAVGETATPGAVDVRSA